MSSDNPWRPATRQAFAFVLNGSSHSIHKLIFVVSRHFSVSYFFLIGVLYSFLSIFQFLGESLILFFLFRVMLEFGRKIGKIVSTGCSIVEESLILFFLSWVMPEFLIKLWWNWMSSTRCFSFSFFKRVLYSFLSIHLLSLENLRSFFSYLGLCYNFWQKDWMSSTRCSSFPILRRCMLYCFLSLHLSLENLQFCCDFW